MYGLDAKTGKNLWWTPGAMQFVAASKARVYATDSIGRILVCDSANGNRLDTIAAEDSPVKLANCDTDRIYLIGHGGLIQCLHEMELDEPIYHGDKERRYAAKTEADAKPVFEKKKEEEKPKPEHHEAKPSEPKKATPKREAAPKRKAGPQGKAFAENQESEKRQEGRQ